VRLYASRSLFILSASIDSKVGKTYRSGHHLPSLPSQGRTFARVLRYFLAATSHLALRLTSKLFNPLTDQSCLPAINESRMIKSDVLMPGIHDREQVFQPYWEQVLPDHWQSRVNNVDQRYAVLVGWHDIRIAT